VAAPPSARDLLEAMDVSPEHVGSAQVDGSGGAYATPASLGTLQPLAGQTMACLSSGRVGKSPQSGTDLGLPGKRGDVTTLEFELTPPGDARTMLLDFYFLSAEYPEFVGSRYNDAFQLGVAGPAWSGNAAIDAQSHPISVNSVLFQVTSSDDLAGSGFHNGVGGGTGWLTAVVPVQPDTPLTVRLSVGDAGDGILDSVVLLDRFRWSTDPSEQATLFAIDEADVRSSPPSIDVTGLPTVCYVGEPCEGAVVLRAQSLRGEERFRVHDQGDPLLDEPARADKTYFPSRIYEAPELRTWTIVVTGEGDLATEIQHTFEVQRPLRLVAPDLLDFGTVRAGSATLADTSCVMLDLGESQELDAHAFRLEFVAPPAGCSAEPKLRYTKRGRDFALALRPVLEGYSLLPSQPLCLEVPLCAGEQVEDGASLRIEPMAPEFADQAVTLPVRWRVQGRSWLSCHLWWILILVGILAAVLLIYGIVAPARFPPAASICVAGSERTLRRAGAVVLRECAGSSPRLFRDARLGLHADGSVNGVTRGALVQIRAVRGGGVVLEKGAIETLNRRSRKWTTPEDLDTGHHPVSAATYRAADTCFSLEDL